MATDGAYNMEAKDAIRKNLSMVGFFIAAILIGVIDYQDKDNSYWPAVAVCLAISVGIFIASIKGKANT